MNPIQKLAVEYLVLILSQQDSTRDTVAIALNRYQLGVLHPMLMTLKKSERSTVYRAVAKITRWKLITVAEADNLKVTLVFKPCRQTWMNLT